MWSDTLLVAERHDIQRLLAWGGVSVVVGCVALLAIRARREARPQLLFHFSLQMALWGEAELVVGVARWLTLGLRDFASAVRLEHALRLAVAVEVGLVVFGLTLAAVSWGAGRRRRMGGIGAGLAIATQGLAVGVLGVPLLAIVSR